METLRFDYYDEFEAAEAAQLPYFMQQLDIAEYSAADRVEAMANVARYLHGQREQPYSDTLLDEVDAIDTRLESVIFDDPYAREARAVIRVAGSDIYALAGSAVEGNQLGKQLTRVPYLERARDLNALAIGDLEVLEHRTAVDDVPYLSRAAADMKTAIWERNIAYDRLLGDEKAARIDSKLAKLTWSEQAKALGSKALQLFR